MTELTHEKYIGSTEVDLESGVLHGKLLYISDVVTYEGSTVPELQAAFVEAVNDYLETCKEIGKEPDLPFKGVFNVRVGPQLHRAVALCARAEEVTLNEWVRNACTEKLESARKKHSTPATTVEVRKVVVYERECADAFYVEQMQVEQWQRNPQSPH